MSYSWIYVVCILLSLNVGFLAGLGSYLPPYIGLSRFKNAMIIFAKEPEFDNFSFMLKKFKYHYLSAYFIIGGMSYMSYGVLLWGSWLLFQEKILIPEVIILLFSFIGYYFRLRRLWRNIKKLGIQTNEEVLTSFQIHRERINIEEVKSFQLFKYYFNDKSKSKISRYNLPLQHNQKRIAKITKQLAKKRNHLSQEKYNFKILILYINYLKRHATFYKWLENDSNNYIDNQYVVIEKEKYENVKILKKVLINNFFAFVNQAEQEFN
ncbi:hypothetical protein [Spiroplasma attinicola]|uniref:hypothetical protein n=1 Tax=Spiroplasma attinicola TaxID=2904537 RepID=UPI002022B2E3|nr:hypothetical protein [Spiroplasma sp. JKS002670]MCL8210253.1 hypothetical protein [Spiroplasma sp. JKS002670]